MIRKFKYFNFNKYLVLILFSLLLIGCVEKRPKPQFIVKNGYIYDNNTNKLYTGVIKDRVRDNIIEYEVIDGVKDGNFKVYFKDGKLEMSGEMKNNKNDGKWTYYYLNGQIESEGIFVNDLPEKRWNWYYGNGKLKESGIFKLGKREGSWTMYKENGDILDHAEYLNGEKIKSTKI